PLVVFGAGVWALASGAIVRAIVSVGIVFYATRAAHFRPRLDWRRTRPYLAFGSRFLAIDFVTLTRDQGFNFGIAAIGGVATLGVWNLAYRILQIPYLLFVPLWRVSFPAMARLVGAGENLRPTVERLIGLV